MAAKTIQTPARRVRATDGSAGNLNGCTPETSTAPATAKDVTGITGVGVANTASPQTSGIATTAARVRYQTRYRVAAVTDGTARRRPATTPVTRQPCHNHVTSHSMSNAYPLPSVLDVDQLPELRELTRIDFVVFQDVDGQ